MTDFTKSTGPLSHAQHLHLKSPSRFLRPPAKMAMLLIVGVLLMISHHSLYRYLDGKPVQQNFDITGQKVTSVLGNLIAYVARTVLAAAISIAFAQMLWSHMRAKDNSITQIDALVSCQQSPFSPSSLPAWSFSTAVLIVVAIAGTSMSVITIFASSSLSVISSHTAYSRPCNVGAPNLANGNLGSSGPSFGHAIFQTVSHASRVIVQGSPLQPMTWCDGLPCQYDIEFVAPAVNCTNTTNSADFNTLLPRFPNNNYTVWNCSTAFDDKNGLVIEAALATSPSQAVRCKAFNATYTARIKQTNFTTSIELLGSPQLYNPLTYHSNNATMWLGLNSIGDSLAQALKGVAVRELTFYGWTPDTNIMAFTWMVKAMYMGINVDLMDIVPSLMHNISLSIASGYLDLPKYYSTVTPYATTCFYPTIRYSYNPRELLVTYGGGILLAGICLFLGWLAQRRRMPGSTDNSLSFSRFVAAVLNNSADAPVETRTLSLTEQTRLQVLEHGQLYVVRNLGDIS